MIEIQLNETSQVPIYKQIREQLTQLIATERLKAGERLPTVRHLSQVLRVNPATVAKAYQELEKEGVLGTGRRRGTIVLSGASQGVALRQSRLTGMVSNSMMEILSQGYTPEELEAAFSMQLTRWRQERETKESAGSSPSKAPAQKIIRVVGSNDMALNLLISRLKHSNPEITVEISAAGSLGGLLALQEGSADLAGTHLLDEETGEYNLPYIKHILQDMEVAIVHLAYREQGLMVAKNNPMKIMGLADLKRPDIRFVNRQKGSGTRVALDYWLRGMGIAPHEIQGYEKELDTHVAVAMSILHSESDAGLGIEAAAHSCNIDFIPIAKERFDLVMPAEKYHSKLFAPLIAIIESDEFRKVVSEMGGYDTSQTGSTAFVK